MNMVPRRIQYGSMLFGILLGLFFVEILARAYVSFVAPTREILTRSVPDPRLGVRPDPEDGGIDARGWRNRSALKAADIVVLGDSMEYGYWVPPPAAWPQRLGQILRRPVYQMAMGEYGPGQYLLLFDDAAALRPKVIIAAYYVGNDLYDAYSLAYQTGENAHTVPSKALQVLVSTDPKVRDSIRAAEAIDPELLRWHYLECDSRQTISDPHLQQVHNVLSIPPLVPLVKDVPSPAPAQSPSIRSRILRLLNASVGYRLVRHAFAQAVNRLVPPPQADYGPPFCIHFQDGRLKTGFAPAAKLLGLDRTDPRIVEGERIGLMAYQALAERCRRAGIRFYVVIHLTKETAFRPRAERLFGNERYLRELWEAEDVARSRALEFFARAHIDVIDPLAALRALIVSGTNPYPEDWDSHPSAVGYDTIAHVVAQRLQRDGFGPPP